MWFSVFVGLCPFFLASVHGTFIPQTVTEFVNSSSQNAEAFQKSSSSTVESFTENGAGGLQEFGSSISESAVESFQESSSNFNQIENSISGPLGQKEYESMQSSSSKTETESFQESSASTFENFTNGAGSLFNQQESSVRASSAVESMVQEAESSFNSVGSSNSGIFDMKEYESSFSKTEESLQSSSFNTMESFTNDALSASGLQKYESSLSQTAESLQESASSNVVESSMNCASGMQEYESSQTSSKSASSKSATNYEHSSLTTSSAFDYDIYANAFEKCKSISDIERQCYLHWLQTFSGESLNYFSDILKYLSVEKALSKEISDYDLVQKEVFSVYKMLSSNGIYDVSTDLSAKTAVYEKCKSKLRKALKGLSQNSSLYKLLKYSVSTDMSTMPCTVGLLRSILKNQETYFSQSSSTSSTKSTNGIRSGGTSTACTASSGNAADITHYQQVLQAANIAETEYQLYSNYLSKLTSHNARSFEDMISFFNKNTQVITPETILDFASLSQEVRSVYNLLVQEQFFASNSDWLANKTKLIELKSRLSSALSYLSEDCCMYQALQYCLEKDISYLPLFVGLSNYLLEQQSSYFSRSSSASSSTTVTSAKSTCGC